MSTTQIQVRRDTATDWSDENPTLAAGEIGFEIDTKLFKIGDGSTAWDSLEYAKYTDSEVEATINDDADHGSTAPHDYATSSDIDLDSLGSYDAGDNSITNQLTATFSGEHDNGTQGSNYTIDWGNGQKQVITLSGSITLSFTDPSGPSNLILRVVQDSTGGRDLTWPSSVLWPGGSKTALSDVASAEDVVSLYYNGTNYYAQMGEDFY